MRIIYRPEIDGLRTVSVFAIIIYHANFILFGNTLFQGGFIGVDIFFVISGYLITTIILKDIFKNNKFSFQLFFERRIRRILPVLLFVIIITSVISYYILLPSSLVDFGKSVLSIIVFVSNVYFNYTGNIYGQESTLLKPLLHTWSLCVEAQFYILFPVFLIIINKFKKNLFKILFLSFLISILFSEYLSKFHPGTNFYQLSSRWFELLIGSLLSYFELNKGVGGSRKFYSILNQICPSLGITLIFYSFLFFNFNKISHPSIITLIPLIGVSLIIWFSKKGELITEILSSKIFVFFGLISYSLFLWHYPIFTFLRYIDIFNSSIWIKLLAILLTIILSILSYYFIERPFRNKNIIKIKALTIYILISVIILLSYSFYILNTKGIKNRFPDFITEELKKKIDQNEFNRVEGNLKKVLLIGDSHADALIYHLNKELTKQSYNLYTQKSMLYLKNFNQIFRKNGNIKLEYIEDNKKIDNFLQEHKNLIVIWHYRWSLKILEEYFDNKEGNAEYQNEESRYFETYLEPINVKTKTLEQRQKFITEGIKLSAKRILEKENSLILVYPVPEMGFDVPKSIINKNIISYFLKNKIEYPVLTVSYEVYKNRNKIIFETLDSIQGPNVYRVYPHQSFCDTVIVNKCVANNKEHLFYYDDDHISLEGSKYIINDIMKAIQNVEAGKKL
jgi:peptidoglycan/LPS O-acetylase OafA/YrhL